MNNIEKWLKKYDENERKF